MKNSIITNKILYNENILINFKLFMVLIFSLFVSRNNNTLINTIFIQIFIIFEILTVNAYIRIISFINKTKYVKEDKIINFFTIINPFIINLLILIFIVTINLILNSLNFLAPSLILLYLIISFLILRNSFNKLGLFNVESNINEKKELENANILVKNQELENKYLNEKVSISKDFIILQNIYKFFFIFSLCGFSSFFYNDFNQALKISILVFSIILFLIAISLLVLSFIRLKRKGVVNFSYYIHEIFILITIILFISINVLIEYSYPIDYPAKSLMPLILLITPILLVLLTNIDLGRELYILKLVKKIDKENNDLESTK